MTPPPPAGCRPVADFDDPGRAIPGYAVRDDGAVLYFDARRRRWVESRPKVAPNGFRKVRVRVGARVREIGVAQLVLRAFVGPRPIGCEPLHFPDPDPGNNALANLRWAPVGSSKVGRMLGPAPPPLRRGTERPNAVLTEEVVRDIRAQYRAGFRYKEIAAELAVNPETVRNVLTGRTWSHVPDPEGPIALRRPGPDPDAAVNTRLDWESVAAIRAGRAAGRTYADLAREHGVDRCTVRDILKGRTWRR